MAMRSGSPGFVAPEVIRGEQTITLCDIFSAGCTIHCALSGAGSPFYENDVGATLRKTLLQDVEFSGSHEIEELSCEGKALLRLMLEKDPRRRVTAAHALQHPWLQKALPN
jgi:serine/threonine protein kinase